jgi:hypothetical protein
MAGHDMKEPMQTYEGFMGLLKVGTVLTVLVTAFVILLIS